MGVLRAANSLAANLPQRGTWLKLLREAVMIWNESKTIPSLDSRLPTLYRPDQGRVSASVYRVPNQRALPLCRLSPAHAERLESAGWTRRCAGPLAASALPSPESPHPGQ